MRLRPRAGWRDARVRAVLRRAGRTVLQAGLLALQLLTLMLLTSRVPGGPVALQVALNFYAVPIALVATPVGLALLPTLSQQAASGEVAAFRRTFTEGLSLALFLAVPAAVGYMTLAGPIARVVATGSMATPSGTAMIAGALAALSVGMAGQAAFFVATQAAYARGATAGPLLVMALQAALCLVLCGVVVTTGADDAGTVRDLAAAYAIASLVGGTALVLVVLGRPLHVVRRAAGAALRVAAGLLVMVPLVLLTTRSSESVVAGSGGPVVAVVLGAVVGAAAFGATQVLMASPELAWLRSGIRRRQRQVAP